MAQHPPTKPETAEHRRDRHELEQILLMAHRRLDQRGVPRTNHMTTPEPEQAAS